MSSKKNIFTYSFKTLLIAILAWEVIFWGVFISLYIYLSEQVEAFRLENDEYLWLFIILPLLIGGFLLNIRWKNKAINSLAEKRLVTYLIQPISTLKTFLRFFLIRNGIAFLIIALLNPQYGRGKQKAISEGIEIMIALDISNSMRALDLDPEKSRLAIAKLSIERLLNNLHGDKVGIIIFAGDAFLQVPMTTDYRTTKMFLSSVSPDMMSNQGTSIGEAIRKALDAFDFENGVNKSIIVMSDGEDFEGDAILAANEAKEKGVLVNTVGMGTPKGTVIPDYKNGKRIGLKKDADGNTVMTKLNQQMLIQIAQAGGGSFTLAEGTYVNLNGLLESIKNIDKKELDSQLYTDYEDQFQWFIGIGLLFLLPSFFVSSKRSGLIHKLQDYEI
ncbi:MAG: VWA domain-containing protein [Putridiphycobacter sp.]